MKKRLFVAVPISERLQGEIMTWEKSYGKLLASSSPQLRSREARRASRSGPVRWLQPKNLHVTLVPPWYDRGTEAAEAKLRLLEGKVGAFEIEFHRVTFGPDLRRPRLVWAEGNTPKNIVELKGSLEGALGRTPETRPFRLHLTLARFRLEDFPQFPVKQLDERVLWRDTVKSFMLMESRLSPAGADYEMIAEFTL